MGKQIVMVTLVCICISLCNAISDDDDVKCPSAELLSPCGCFVDKLQNMANIICAGDKEVDLHKVFGELSKEENALKRFGQIEIVNTGIKSLPENVFGDVTFKWIHINAKNLEKIHWKAFAKHNNTVEQLVIEEGSKHLKNMESPYSLFDMINTLENLKVLRIEAGIMTFPDKAFSTRLTQLANINIKPNKHITIKGSPFHELKALEFLKIDNSSIDHIPEYAFAMKKSDVARFHLFLDHNQLNSPNFEVGALANINRPTEIYLNSNKFTYLDEKVFKPFLKANSQNAIINIQANEFTCSECRNHWLIKERSSYQSKINMFYCIDNDSREKLFWDLNEKNFKDCKSNKLNSM